MGSDRARISHHPARQYREVVSQQGRVTLEADANEAARLASEALRYQSLELLGPSGTPDDGYEALPKGSSFEIGSGTYWVGGLRLTLAAPMDYEDQPDWLDRADDPLWHDPDDWSGPAHLVLLCREQEIGAVEDPALREVALGGPDTCARTRLLQRALLAPTQGTRCAQAAADIDDFWWDQGLQWRPATAQLHSQSRLLVSILSTEPADSPCDPPAQSGYLGADNQLIRVQIVDFDPAHGQGRMLWGYNNAAALFRCTCTDRRTLNLAAPPVSAEQTPAAGQAVQVLKSAADLGDDAWAAALLGPVFTLETPYQPDSRQVTLPWDLPPGYAAAPGTAPLYLRLWQGELPFVLGTPVALPGTGLAVTLTGASAGRVHVGDYWCIAVRPLTPDAVYPQRLLAAPQPPEGPRQWTCSLAVLSREGNTWTTLDDCRLPFDHLANLTARRHRDPEVFYVDDAGRERRLDNGQALPIGTLARGLRLELPAPVTPASVNDASLLVTAEVPVLARGLFEAREIADPTLIAGLGYEVPRTDLRAEMLVGYQPVVMAASVSTDSLGHPTWRPVSESVVAFGHLASRSFRNADTETLNASFDTFADQSGNGDWRVNGDGVVIQLDHLQGQGHSIAVHRQPIDLGLTTLRASVRPHLRSDFSDIGLVFNYVSESNYYFVAPTFDHRNGSITLYYGTPQRYATLPVTNPGPARKLTHMALAIKQISGQLLVSYVFGFADRSELKSTVASTALQVFPSAFAPGSRIGVTSRYSAQYEHLELVYPSSKLAAIPLAPPRILTRMTLKRGLLKPQGLLAADESYASESFERWFWLLPGRERFGYEPSYYYDYDPWFAGIGSNLL